MLNVTKSICFISKKSVTIFRLLISHLYSWMQYMNICSCIISFTLKLLQIFHILSQIIRNPFSAWFFIFYKNVCPFRKKKSDTNQKGSVTHTSLRPTSSPSWEEMISTSMDASKAGDECMYCMITLITTTRICTWLLI